MHLTPARLAAVYDCLRAFPPFESWRLPESDEVEFSVGVRVEEFGWYAMRNGQHTIEVSGVLVNDWQTLVETVAHEMVHLHQARSGPVDHDCEWRRLAGRVCRTFGWKLEGF